MIKVEQNQMGVPFISVIVPVFNTEPYISRCIDSILVQSFAGFELLLVDDGSTDDSGAVCDAYAEKDKRIRVFHKENGGVSSARNLGIDNSTGEWVAFVDADDELLPGGLQVLADGISDDVDMVMGGYEIYDEEGKLIYAVDARIEKIVANETAAKEMYEPSDYKYQGYVWNKLVRRSLVIDAQLRFEEGVVFNEDRLFITELICALERKVFYTTTPVYKYYERMGGTVMSIRKGFNPGFATDFEARIKMREAVRSRFNNKELVSLADYEVYKGYRRIVGMAQCFHHEDPQLLSDLRSQLMDAIGYRQFLRFEMQRDKRRVLKLLRKIVS